MMESVIIAIFIFIVVFFFLQASILTYRSIRNPEQGKIKKRLDDLKLKIQSSLPY